MRLPFIGSLLLILALPALAGKPATHRAFVTAGPDGVFYARSVPSNSVGDKGSTEVFRVEKNGDQALDRYEWYNASGLILAWSPIAGKVAIMRMNRETGKPPELQTEFSFYMGGKLLRSYTTAQVLALGAELIADYPRGTKRAGYRILGAEQIPLTNTYVYSVLVKDKKVMFDILTGEPYRAGNK